MTPRYLFTIYKYIDSCSQVDLNTIAQSEVNILQDRNTSRILCLILKSVTPTKCQLTVGFKIFNDVSSYQEVSLVTIINYPNSDKF